MGYRIIKQMDERSLIINAIKNGTPEDSISFPGPDAILDLAKKRKRRESFKQKSCGVWNNADFLRYIDFTMKEFGVSRIMGNIRRDGDYINQLYDRMVKKIGDQMSNEILRSYIDWWISIWAPRLTGSGFHLKNLLDDKHINRFFQRYREMEIESPSNDQISEDDLMIFELGGLPLLAIKRGLVIGYHVATGKLPEPQRALQAVLGDLSREMLIAVVKATIQNAPYPKSCEIDFLGITAPFLKQENIVEFDNVSSESYFKG